MSFFDEPIFPMASLLHMTELLTLALLTFPRLHMLKHWEYVRSSFQYHGFYIGCALALKYTSLSLIICLAFSYSQESTLKFYHKEAFPDCLI